MKLSFLPKLLLVTATSSILAMNAFAGVKSTANVGIASGYISGSMGTARNSSDSRQELTIVDNGTSTLVIARTASGSFASCTTTNFTHRDQLRGATDTDFLLIRYNSGTCTSVSVQASSRYEPKR